MDQRTKDESINKLEKFAELVRKIPELKTPCYYEIIQFEECLQRSKNLNEYSEKCYFFAETIRCCANSNGYISSLPKI